MPQHKKHRYLQDNYHPCPSAKMLFPFLVKFSVFAVHRTEYQNNPCRCCKRNQHCRNRHPDKQAARIHRDEQYKARTDITEQPSVTVKTLGEAPQCHKRKGEHADHQKPFCKQPNQECRHRFIGIFLNLCPAYYWKILNLFQCSKRLFLRLLPII